jgi:ATP-dependent helicase/nuclease subunit B
MAERVFLGWDRPFLGLLTEWLLARRDELPGLLVVVPTAQAGRRLREALAESAGALLAPKVVTPEFFFRPAEPDGIAMPIEARFAWIEVLQGMSGRDARALFPVEPVERSFSWAAGVAKELEKVRNALAEGGKFFADAAELSPERDRWVDLMEVERRVMARFARWQLEDPLMAKVRVARDFVPPPGIAELVIAGVPDPVPLALEVWKRIGVPVKVLVHAPESERAGFDDWGRPLVGEAWIKRPTPVARERIHLVAGPAEMAAKAVECCGGLASDEVAIGLCDPACGPALEAAFAEAGWPAWNPEGRMAGRAMMLLLDGFAGLARRGDRWDPAAGILRNPLLAEILGRKGMHAALRALDELEQAHLPDSVARVRELCGWKRSAAAVPDEGLDKLAAMIAWCVSWRDRFVPGRSGEALAEWVAAMAEIDDGAEGQFLTALAEAVEPVKRLEARGLLKGPGEALELALSSIETLRSTAGREQAVIDLSGWLELSHGGGRRMILAGMHEGCVPDGNLDDAFLPDGVRQKLELRDAGSRHARDAYLLHSFAASRELDVIVAKVDASGEPRRPSRLLLAARGVELAERVRALSGSPAAAPERLASWTRGDWKLELCGALKPYLDGERMLSPSAIRDYLHCPFRFYLKRVLKWERHDAAKMEMDALDFGNLCHDALEQMGLDEAMAATVDPPELRDFLWEKMDARLAKYGSNLSLPLLVQREAARSRLERFAELEVAQRIEGWQTKHVELKVGKDLPWEIDGQAVSMQIDRVDFHPRHGWRVLDYKTSARAETPKAAHLRRVSDKRRNFGATMPAARGTDEVWKNVQVPLYAAFVQQWLGLDAPPAIGYVNLPATLNDVGFEMWQDFTPERMDRALEWSRGVIGALRRSVHWPPVELSGKEAGYDDFAAMAPDGLDGAVTGELINEMKTIAAAWSAERGAA